MPISPQFQALLPQFRSQYSMGCLSTELLTIQQGQYVVRASVRVGDVLLATAMAAAAEIEAAEDQAKVRVLESIGLAAMSQPAGSATISALRPNLSPVKSVPQAEASLPEVSPKPEFKPEVAVPPTAWSLPDQPSLPELMSDRAPALITDRPPAMPLPQADDRSYFPESDPVLDHPQDQPDTESPTPTFETEIASSRPKATSAQASKTEKATKRKSAAEAVSMPPQADRSEEIMKIGIEMKRLGWSTEQGREHLKRTYNKRSRQELNDAELLDFLHYLEAQNSPLQTPF